MIPPRGTGAAAIFCTNPVDVATKADVLFAVPVAIVSTCKVPDPDILPSTVNPVSEGKLVLIPTLPLACALNITSELS